MEVQIGALLVLLVSVVAGQNVDLTVSSGAKGRDVVETVVDRIRSNCIFPEDRLFLRRLAYAESKDGADPKTYRKDYDGGIWQVDEAMYNATRRCPFIVSDECALIGSAFNITWRDTTWQDLRKPLYSGLAASLYMLIRLGFINSMPGDLPGQADTWAHYYHLGSPDSDFISAANAVKDDCKGQLDLAFIIDSSGSIYFTDYITMLMFIQNVTRALDFGPDATRFAAIVYGTQSDVSFYFDTYTKKSDIVTAISSIKKDDGGTHTYDAIDLATDRVFTTYHGARPGVPKVAILLTDGASSNLNRTVQAAERAKRQGITFFTVGIGSINRQELQAVATEPNCTHVFVLDNFSEIDSLLNEMRKGSCSAPIVISTNTTMNDTVTVSQELTANKTEKTTIKIDQEWHFASGKGDVVKAEVTCGILDVYTSFETPNPGPAFFDQKFSAKDGQPAIISLVASHDGRPLYVTVIGTKLPPSASGLLKCQDAKYTVSVDKKQDIQILCRENGVWRNCTKQDYIHAEVKTLICDNNNWGVLANPCTPDNINKGILVHPHPYDTSMFIKCDLTGKMYVTMCPDHDIFNKNTMSCGFGSISVPSGGTLLPSHTPSPCTPQKIQNEEYFFPYPDDKHKFIHCDVWGGAWVQHCDTNFLWNDIAKTCVADFFHEFDPSTPQPVTVHNPCLSGSAIMFYPHPDQSKFIHCDIAGNYWVQSCPLGMRYEPTAYVCVRQGMQGR
ncbi:uncharacterized protein LOC124121112 [Haliotis rufescens]|uniref:uncharacterized protein LOC124121112 n=1 Tax=Haliotis rufescens TaxID=6454 RepID=UPI00201F38B5|nr:uncharacterized protein LOC124121112 [Haliotis rufescens]